MGTFDLPFPRIENHCLLFTTFFGTRLPRTLPLAVRQSFWHAYSKIMPTSYMTELPNKKHLFLSDNAQNVFMISIHAFKHSAV
ncbi:hypothetical protein JBF11_07380 [Taurinivorans muris]|uniref:Uncharacterized protein n=1 Tax=Taurinivorans muris TaxID=2787751 RepID=A0ABY5XZE6_9BACT|nr:hypothetical protein JBF11_07380 [Desulfovibrionaceae bacterium LT0009]